MDSEPTPSGFPVLLPMPSEMPGETDREYAIRALRQNAPARVAAREEREESENPGTRGYPMVPPRPDKG